MNTNTSARPGNVRPAGPLPTFRNPLAGFLFAALLTFFLSAGSVAAIQDGEADTAGAAAPSPDSDTGSGESADEQKVPLPDSALLAGLKLRSIGPALMSGRISDLAIDPLHPNTWYVAVGSGNLWKTVNAGTTFTPIFDNYGSYSIGCVTIDPSNCETVWVGTGENVGGRHVGFGDGVYRSLDGGKTFENLGLKESRHISKILVDQRDSNTILVAAQGPLWNPGGERGLYRSEDGGQTWTCTLKAGEWTGCTDVVSDPSSPDILYAALHQRHRTVAALLNTGPESGIHKSTDGGRTWRRLGGGLPGGDMGKISLAVSPQQNHVVYATVEVPNRLGGFYRSTDRGESWVRQSDFVSGGTGPHYYQEIWADPHRFDCIYQANNSLVRSVDGGKTWEVIEGDNKHGDNHAVAFHPEDPDFALVGTDGGLYVSRDSCQTYIQFENLPITQFYKVDVDYDLPFYNIIGGTQDNSTQYGPSRTRLSVGIQGSDWIVPIGGDGHDNALDPENPDIIYGESQEGFINRYDRKTGQSISIRPQPAAGEPELGFNWDSPILLSPHNSSRIYIGSNHLHRSDDRGDTWTTVSPDLSRNPNRLALPLMGRKQSIDAGLDLYAMSKHGNITSISESPLVEGLIYCGTDDGIVQVTEDGGKNWRRIERFFDVPDRAFVNDIKADRHNPDTVYVALDNHKTGDLKPYLLRSRDRGQTWESMVGDLPERHLVWRIEQDHVVPELFFLGTEFGLFTSVDAGGNWSKMTGGMPNIPVRDIAVQRRENDLVLATFGRSFYVLDDYTPLREVATVLAGDAAGHLFSPRQTPWFVESRVIPRGSFGDGHFTRENPPTGVNFTVWIRESLKTLKEIRQESEQAAVKEGADVPLATWEELRAEAEQRPAGWFVEILGEGDAVIARVNCANSKGLQRLTWDMRLAPLANGSPGMLAAPGKYTARLAKIEGTSREIVGQSVDVSLEPVFVPAIEPVDRSDAIAFQRELSLQFARLNKMQQQLEETQLELAGRRELILVGADQPEELLKLVAAAQSVANELTRKISGDPDKAARSETQVPTPGERMGGVLYSVAGSLHGPTGTNRQQVEIATGEINELEPRFAELEQGTAALRTAMDAAGLVWVQSPPSRRRGE